MQAASEMVTVVGRRSRALTAFGAVHVHVHVHVHVFVFVFVFVRVRVR